MPSRRCFVGLQLLFRLPLHFFSFNPLPGDEMSREQTPSTWLRDFVWFPDWSYEWTQLEPGLFKQTHPVILYPLDQKHRQRLKSSSLPFRTCWKTFSGSSALPIRCPWCASDKPSETIGVECTPLPQPKELGKTLPDNPNIQRPKMFKWFSNHQISTERAIRIMGISSQNAHSKQKPPKKGTLFFQWKNVFSHWLICWLATLSQVLSFLELPNLWWPDISESFWCFVRPVSSLFFLSKPASCITTQKKKQEKG